MNKYFIKTINGKLAFYMYEGLNEKKLNKDEILDLTFEINFQDIIKYESDSNTIFITFEDGTLFAIADVEQVFKFKLMENIKKKVKNYLEEENFRKYKENYQSNSYPKINRTKNLGQKFIAVGLSAILAVGMMAASHISLKRDNDKSEGISQEQLLNTQERDALQSVFFFDDKTQTGQLERTIENCEDYLEKYIERYGLPRNLVYALVATESGELDCNKITNGSVGPMQINLDSHHREFYRIPYYENGVLTGYDEFWVCDANKLGDAEEREFFKDKNVLYIQDVDNNFQIGCAYLRKCIDKYKNIFIAIDAYNKGINALTNLYGKMNLEQPIEYFMENMNDFRWAYIIPMKSNIGNPNYLTDVLRYLKTDENGLAQIDYRYGNETIQIDLTNEKILIEGLQENHYGLK